jgi:hypothetical protein
MRPCKFGLEGLVSKHRTVPIALDQSEKPKSLSDGKGGGSIVLMKKDAFDLWWAWAEKPPHRPLKISAEIHKAVMALPPKERRDRAKANEAVRDGLRLGPLRPAGTADGVPKATE